MLSVGMAVPRPVMRADKELAHYGRSALCWEPVDMHMSRRRSGYFLLKKR